MHILRKIALSLLIFAALPISAQVVPAQNQVIFPPFIQNGIVFSTSSSPTAKLTAISTTTLSSLLNIPASTPSVGSEGYVQFASSTSGFFDGESTLFWSKLLDRLGIQKSSPEAPLHVASTVAETLADVTNLSAVLTPESLISAPSVSAAISHIPKTPTGSGTSEVDYGSGNFTSSFQTYDYTIVAYRTVNGVKYTYSNATAQYIDGSGDGHTFNVSVYWDAMTYADGYYVRNTTTGNVYDVVGTNSVIDNGSGGASDVYTDVGSGIIANGQTITYYPVGIGTSPSGQTYYSGLGTSYDVTDTLNDGATPFVITHTSGVVPYFSVDNSTSNNLQITTSPYVQTSLYGSATDISTQHYGFLSNGSTLNKTYKVHTYDSYRGIYSSGVDDAITDPNDAAYYSVTITFTGVTHPPALMSYKKFRKQTSGAYGNAIFDSSTTFYDDNLSTEYAQSATVTPTSALPNSLIAEADSDAITDPVIAVIRSTAASNHVASLQGQSNIGGNLWTLRNSDTTSIYLGNDQSSPNVFLGNLTAPQTQIGSNTVFNLQKTSVGDFKIWGSNATLPNFYTVGIHNSVYFGKNADASIPYATVVISPKATTQGGLDIRQFSASQASDLLRLTGSTGASLTNFNSLGYLGIGTSALTTSRLTLNAGSTSLVPLVINSGSLKSSPLNGAIERLTDKLYFTIQTGTARKEIALNDGAITASWIPFATTNGRYTGSADLTFSTSAGLVGNESGGTAVDFRWETDTDTHGLFVDASGNGVGVGTAAPDRKFHVETADAVTNAVTYASRFSHITSGTAAIGFGTGHEFELENALGTNKVVGTQEYTFSDATNGSEDVTWKLRLMKVGGLADALTVSSIGDLSVAGDLNIGTFTGNVGSGVYTPTLTGVTNVTSTTARQATYMRVGNTVTVAGQFDITPTGVGLTVVGISLPVASNFGTVYQLGGTGHSPTVAGHGASIMADATNDRATFSYVNTAASADTMTFTFTYQVI